MSTAFVFTSLEEGFGMPIVEAMASFTPVITSNNSACLEIAGDAAVTVDPRNPIALAEALNLVCNQPTFASQLVSLGSTRSRRFTWETSARQYLSMYYRLQRATAKQQTASTSSLRAIEVAA
jgi:glycosyltransferase involved in cell wall biosynthesis